MRRYLVVAGSINRHQGNSKTAFQNANVVVIDIACQTLVRGAVQEERHGSWIDAPVTDKPIEGAAPGFASAHFVGRPYLFNLEPEAHVIGEKAA